ncbi:MAG: FtsX-like permease family protein [Bacteroidetes Order II. Incertae sedis bacterium]|nr:FtsX-like permease family protein [Bacteroidetes Order II. bacterium]
MTPLTKKMFRDLWHHRGQMISIAAVVATAIMTVLSMRGVYESLVTSRDAYYETSKFPDVWVQLERAPESLRKQIAEIPGVASVDTRVSFLATINLDQIEKPASGLFVSIDNPDAMLGRLHLRSGRFVRKWDRDKVLLSEKFAITNSFEEGDSIEVVINGQLRAMEVVGVAISPEHMYIVPPGSFFPDNEAFGIVWMGRQTLSALDNMESAFSEAVLTLQAGAVEEQVKADLDELLIPYGGRGSYGRPMQISHQYLENELKQNKTMGTAIPAVFLAVVAFLLNIVLRRLISTQRQEIAVLKAFGYSNADIGRFYFQFSLVAVLVGALVGLFVGVWLGDVMIEMYKEFFVFPNLQYKLSGSLLFFALLVSILAATVGALGGVRNAVALPPAEAMRPQAPARFHPGIFERMGLGTYLSAATRMVLRNIERRPMKSILSALGVSFSVAILIIGLFMFDGVEYMMNLQFNVAQREDISISFNRPLTPDVELDILRIPGVAVAEPFRMVPARFHSGHLKKEAGITGRSVAHELQRIITADGDIIPLPLSGIVISKFMADHLQVRRGDRVSVEILEGRRPWREVEIVEVVEDFMGVSAYMEIGQLHRLVGGARSVSGANVKVALGQQEKVSRTLSDLPAVAGVASPRSTYEIFQKRMSEGLFIGIFFLIGFSSVIAVSVIYNGARISLSERGRELASLRVLGFSKREVAVLLFAEQGIITFLAIPIGWYIGYLLSQAIALSLITESYRIPLMINFDTYVYAAGITLIAAIGSSWLVRRRLDRYDLISVLKTRD